MTWLFFWLTDDAVHNYTPEVAVAIAYELSVEETQPGPVNGKPDPNCKYCKGTGKIRTGDDQGWTECDCVSQPSEQPKSPEPPPLQTIPRRSH